MKKYLFVLILFGVLRGTAQPDTVFLELPQLMEMAISQHPIIRQAKLQDDLAASELLYARGGLDPKVQSSYQLKDFQEKTYYEKFYTALKIPTWFPLDPKVEIYQNQGEYLNPESYVSGANSYWQMTTGVSLPIGKGLFIDERRVLIQQARAFGGLAEAEKIKLTNKVLLIITKAYWDWFFAYEKYVLTERGMAIAEEVFRRVKLDHSYGELSVVDTIQAKITLQSRQADFEKATLDLEQARLALSIHLWTEEEAPLELTGNVLPTRQAEYGIVPQDSSLAQLIDWASVHHPEIQKIRAKQNQLDIEQRWNREGLKPEINLSYSLIDAPFSRDGVQSPQWDENYKIGMDFSFPLLLRKERGKLQKTQIYQQSIEFDRYQTTQEIAAGIRGTYAALKTNERLTTQYLEMSENYNRLFEAEVFNLESGESDLFKLNIQQDKYLDSMVKYLEVLVKYEKLKMELPHAVGLPYLSYQKLYE